MARGFREKDLSIQDAQAKADKQLPDDDLRVVDDVVFRGAISTFDANREAKPEQVLKVYLKSLEERAAKLEHSQPGLETLALEACRFLVGNASPLSTTSIRRNSRVRVWNTTDFRRALHESHLC